MKTAENIQEKRHEHTSCRPHGQPITRPGNVEAVEAIATQAGFTPPPGTIAALFDAIDVTELGLWEAMARMSLTITQGDTE